MTDTNLIERLIEQLKELSASISRTYPKNQNFGGLSRAGRIADNTVKKSIKALTSLQEENEKLKAELELYAEEPFYAENTGDARFTKNLTIDQRLAHVVEECGEALAAAGKCQRWGFNSVNPLLPPKEQETNIEWLFREMDDVRGAINRFTLDYTKALKDI
ncbi:MAG: hypothetical protein COA69_00030 [Robiginitomaculum sp.]|nr:MAG: hypothetical protein COA69_00030 [Robiginitomaculum sp.]